MSVKLRITIWADVHRSSSTFSCWKMATIELCLAAETWIRPVLQQCLYHRTVPAATASALPSSTAHLPNWWPWGTAWSFCRGCVWLRPGWIQRCASVWGRTRQPYSSRKGYCLHQQHVGMKWKVRMDVTKTHIYHTYKYFKFKFKYIFKIKKNPKDKNA